MSDKTLKLKHIAIDEYNYDRLASLGHVPMSFNQVVTKVLDEYYNTIIKKKEQEPQEQQKEGNLVEPLAASGERRDEK
jgi:hypothetical protein